MDLKTNWLNLEQNAKRNLKHWKKCRHRGSKRKCKKKIRAHKKCKKEEKIEREKIERELKRAKEECEKRKEQVDCSRSQYQILKRNRNWGLRLEVSTIFNIAENSVKKWK